MTLSERSAYLKGLLDGLDIDKEKPEGKVLTGIVELLQDITRAVNDLQENAIAVSDELDEIEEDLDAIEDYLMDDDDDDDEDDDFEIEDEDDYDFADDDGDEFSYDEEAMYEVTCPKCGEVTQVDEETLLNETMSCPNCGEPWEFEFDEEDEED